MKVKFSIEHISTGTLARLCGGEIRVMGNLDACSIKGICTDSREAAPGYAFAALRGERVDGHSFIPNVLAAGCNCVICERGSEALQNSDAIVILVKDTELALCRLANSYKQYLRAKTVAVTGSVGKTTTKDLIASVLSQKCETFSTTGNHNSLVGMPMSMLECSPDAKWAVLEMGMSAMGEIERLSITAEPEIAVITNIGTSHLESLGSRKNICRAKLEVLSGLTTGGILILNGDEPLLFGVRGKSYRTVYCSIKSEKAEFFAKNIKVTKTGTCFDIVYPGGTEKDLHISVLGRHTVYSALYAFAVGLYAGLTAEEIRRGMEAFLPTGMRQQIYNFNDITIIEDCYNASPESMIAAVDVLDTYCRETGGRSVAVLGDMLELGEDSPSLHRMVGDYLASKRVQKLYTVGRGGNQIAVGAMQNGMKDKDICKNPNCNDLEWTAKELCRELLPGDVVLFKASRAVGAEQLINYIKEHR